MNIPEHQELAAPDSWCTVDVVSDLHLQAGLGHVEVWVNYLNTTTADALFILGDLFEVWVGDDAYPRNVSPQNFEVQCLEQLSAISFRLPIFVMHGNRDFLLGSAAAALGGFSLLTDPCVLSFGGQRWLLTHGDALCTGDTAYQAFRHRVRNSAWQIEFLAQPASVRRQAAQEMRKQSQEQQAKNKVDSSKTDLDVNNGLAMEWLQAFKADMMIHGHTHRPADHQLSAGHVRMVLSDWDVNIQNTAASPRAQVLRLSAAASSAPSSPSTVRVNRINLLTSSATP
ncbi:MAG: UDP-2,3-diacylglucosamine diphosphatase [Betaproteobacteria bacterium]|nr:UDP-2,3-diacylglucosamine diphosphatase [Betaproteobacteria bacterium]